jgi:hypothetical protein
MSKKKNYGQLWMPTVQEAVEDSFEERPAGMPSLSVIKAETAKLGLPDSDAEAIYHAWMANGFKNARGHKIISWHSAIRTWAINRFFPSQKEALRAAAARPKPPEPPSWVPPTKEAFLAYCQEKKMTGSYGLRLYRFLVARNWKYFGVPVTSDEQWKAICHTHEFNDR